MKRSIFIYLWGNGLFSKLRRAIDRFGCLCLPVLLPFLKIGLDSIQHGRNTPFQLRKLQFRRGFLEFLTGAVEQVHVGRFERHGFKQTFLVKSASSFRIGQARLLQLVAICFRTIKSWSGFADDLWWRSSKCSANNDILKFFLLLKY